MALVNERQRAALDEVRAVAAADGQAVELVEWRMRESSLQIEITLDCRGVPRAGGGVPVRQRERFTLWIGPSFPLAPPSVTVPHLWWAGHPHVQWGKSLCLYQAPTTEWVPSDGMFGLLERLWEFVCRAAQNRLDEWGGPRHPPVAYVSDKPMPSIVVRANTPTFHDPFWTGVAKLDVKTAHRIDVVEWAGVGTASTGTHAAAFLVDEPFPFEFPKRVADVTSALEHAGLSRKLWLLGLETAAQTVAEDLPLIVFVGTPMRGVRGGTPVQHLAAWHVPASITTCLRNSALQFSDDVRFRELGGEFERLAVEWAENAPVDWCPVYEDREETTRRRDERSPMQRLRGAHVVLWGCGALGSSIAEQFARADVAKLELVDYARVGPGLLVRQRFEDLDVGRGKAEALADRLRRINSSIEIRHACRNVLRDADDSWRRADVLVDATASPAVATLLEEKRRDGQVPNTVSMMVGHQCSRGLVSFVPGGSAQGPLSATRVAKLAACRDNTLASYAEDFWPERRRTNIFQPEPGCSDATFRGSAAEVDALASVMVLEAVRRLASGDGGTAFVSIPTLIDGPAVARVQLGSPRLLIDENLEYRVLVDQAAQDQIDQAIRASQETRGARVETGGVLFGQRDDAARVVWVTIATGPPPDSRATEDGFECGIEGIAELATDLKKILRGAAAFIGMWHTHPDTAAIPSNKDNSGMGHLLRSADGPRRQLLYIIGRRGQDHRVYLYERPLRCGY